MKDKHIMKKDNENIVNYENNILIRQKIIKKLGELEESILTLDKEDKKSINKIKKDILSLKKDIIKFGDIINLNGYETYFIKKHIEKYECFFLRKIM